MNTLRWSLLLASLPLATAVAVGHNLGANSAYASHAHGHSSGPDFDHKDDSHKKADDRRGTPRFVAKVRSATERFKNVDQAIAEGYAEFLGCVSGRNGGAMGVHYINGSLVGDGVVNADTPEALIYEPQPGGQLRLVAVEYLTFAPVWDPMHADPPAAPPALEGHVFSYTGEPNGYRAPAHYELHVWAWKDNPNGTFADWNPQVSCNWYKSP